MYGMQLSVYRLDYYVPSFYTWVLCNVSICMYGMQLSVYRLDYYVPSFYTRVLCNVSICLSIYLSISLVSPDFLSKKLHPIHTPFHSSRLLSDTGVHFLYMKKGLQGFISILFLNCRVYFSSQETRGLLYRIQKLH